VQQLAEALRRTIDILRNFLMNFLKINISSLIQKNLKIRYSNAKKNEKNVKIKMFLSFSRSFLNCDAIRLFSAHLGLAEHRHGEKVIQTRGRSSFKKSLLNLMTTK